MNSRSRRRKPNQPSEPWDDLRRQRAQVAARQRAENASKPRQWYEKKRWIAPVVIAVLAVTLVMVLFVTDPVQRTLAAVSRPHVVLACVLSWAMVTLWWWAVVAGAVARRLTGQPDKVRAWMWVALGSVFALGLTVITPKRSSGDDVYRAELAENTGDMAKAIEAGAEAGAITLLSAAPALFLAALVSKRLRLESDRHFVPFAMSVITLIALIALAVALTAADLGPGHRAPSGTEGGGAGPD